MSELSLSFLGSGNAFAPGGLCWNGFLVNERYLFESPPQALMSLNRLGIDPNVIEAVVISHHHGDHFLGLPFLLLHWKHLGRTAPVSIVGPPGTERVARTVSEAVYPGLLQARYLVNWIEAAAGSSLNVGDLELAPVAVKHDPALDHSLGYSASVGGHRLGYTGDSAICDGVLDLARSSDVLVSECASRSSHNAIHMNLVDDMPTVRAAMRAEAALVLTHVAADVNSTTLPNTRIARDFETYRF